ncbi:hypothetical protein ACFQWF_14580 [Methylorubrum suomiense]
MLERREDNTEILVPPDQSALIRTCLGLGVQVIEHSNGRLGIAVDQEPPGASNTEYKALREFMEETAVAWLRQVAPHRLADCFQCDH